LPRARRAPGDRRQTAAAGPSIAEATSPCGHPAATIAIAHSGARYPQSGGPMTDKNIDKAKGRVKEAAGALSGNQRLKNEGRDDQAKSSVKNAAEKLVDTIAGGKKH
jgi:uncharacterized protein YjbJ (UPF0337 family)